MPLTILTESELELILPWRNAPDVRQAMFSHHEISLDEHRAWFARMQQDPTRRWYLYRDAESTPQGVLYLTNLDLAQRTTFMGFYAQPEAPSGTGRRMEFAAMELVFDALGLHKVSCEVLANNVRVVNMHKKAGLTEEGRFREQHFDGENRVDVIRLSILASEWATQRDRLARVLLAAPAKQDNAR
jgi:UDP-4-amino-4,6-dideoxy-N-acetyl-beta-L-altrosamine N-acetyltransferase